MFNKLRNITIPPVCIWGTLLSTKASIAASTIESNISYGSHLAAVKVDKVQTEVKNKMEDCKVKHEEKKAEKEAKKKEKEAAKNAEKKEAENKVETTYKEEVKDETPEQRVEVVIDNKIVNGEVVEQTTTINMPAPEPVKEEEELIYAPDFSNLQRGVIIETVEPEDIRDVPKEEEKITTPVDKDEELKPVTEEDLDELVKKMGGSPKWKDNK